MSMLNPDDMSHPTELCACVCIDPGEFQGENMHPPEWEQDPLCFTHQMPGDAWHDPVQSCPPGWHEFMDRIHSGTVTIESWS